MSVGDVRVVDNVTSDVEISTVARIKHYQTQLQGEGPYVGTALQ